MLTFKEFLLERRRGGEKLNPRVSAVMALEPYKDDQDVFITYTQIEKIGINPNSEYNTPNGIYTYPLKRAWEKYYVKGKGELDVPFAGDAAWVNAVKIKSNAKVIRDIGVDYSSKDWDEDIPKLAKIFIDHPFSTKNSKAMVTMLKGIRLYDEKEMDFVEPNEEWYFKNRENVLWNVFKAIKQNAMENAYSPTIGGQLWNLTKMLSTVIKNTKNIAKKVIEANSQIDETLISIQRLEKPLDLTDRSVMFTINSRTKKLDNPAPNVWTWIWLNMGYAGVADRTGFGIIHDAEPVQAVFFKKSAFDVLGRFMNKGYERVKMKGAYIITGTLIHAYEIHQSLKRFLHKNPYKSLCTVLVLSELNNNLKYHMGIGGGNFRRSAIAPHYVINKGSGSTWLKVERFVQSAPDETKTSIEFMENEIKINSRTFKYDSLIPPLSRRALALSSHKLRSLKTGLKAGSNPTLDGSVIKVIHSMVEDDYCKYIGC